MRANNHAMTAYGHSQPIHCATPWKRMKRPCSQACKLSAKYASAGACAITAVSAARAIRPTPAVARRGAHASNKARVKPAISAAIEVGVRQASACCGPKLSAVDKVVTPIPDAVVEPAETVVVTLTDGANYDLGSPATATVTTPKTAASG